VALDPDSAPRTGWGEGEVAGRDTFASTTGTGLH
jgi:hypothetical protein